MKKTKFEPMLAARKLPPDLTFPKLASFKLDGYRALVKDGRVYSRKLKPILNEYVQSVLGRKFFNGLDGELAIGPPNDPGLIQKMGAIRRIEGTPDFTFYVFDCFRNPEDAYAKRLLLTQKIIEDAYENRIEFLEHFYVGNKKDLLILEQDALDRGYEGLILRDPEGPYKYGRSTERQQWMLKVKRWSDDEMVITGFEEEMENTNEAKKNELGRTKRSSAKAGMVGKGQLGAFIGYDIKTDQPVRVGGGLTAGQRLKYWQDRRKLKGKIITYKHFDKTGVKEKRRFTIFRAFRDKDDL